MTTRDLQATLDDANNATADLRIIEYALHAAAYEDAAPGAPTRRAVLERAVDLMHAHLDTLESALDTLEDLEAAQFDDELK